MSLLDRGSFIVYAGKLDAKTKKFLEAETKFFLASGAPVEFDLNENEQFLKFLNTFRPAYFFYEK